MICSYEGGVDVGEEGCGVEDGKDAAFCVDVLVSDSLLLLLDLEACVCYGDGVVGCIVAGFEQFYDGGSVCV